MKLQSITLTTLLTLTLMACAPDSRKNPISDELRQQAIISQQLQKISDRNSTYSDELRAKNEDYKSTVKGVVAKITKDNILSVVVKNMYLNHNWEADLNNPDKSDKGYLLLKRTDFALFNELVNVLEINEGSIVLRLISKGRMTSQCDINGCDDVENSGRAFFDLVLKKVQKQEAIRNDQGQVISEGQSYYLPVNLNAGPTDIDEESARSIEAEIESEETKTKAFIDFMKDLFEKDEISEEEMQKNLDNDYQDRISNVSASLYPENQNIVLVNVKYRVFTHKWLGDLSQADKDGFAILKRSDHSLNDDHEAKAKLNSDGSLTIKLKKNHYKSRCKKSGCSEPELTKTQNAKVTLVKTADGQFAMPQKTNTSEENSKSPSEEVVSTAGISTPSAM